MCIRDRDTSGDSMGIDASSAIMKTTISWNGDILESSAFPMMRMTNRTIRYKMTVLISTIVNVHPSL